MSSLPGTLEAAASATDYFQVTCSNDGSGEPASIVAEIRDEPPVADPLPSVQLQRGAVATNTTDATDGDAGASPLAFIDTAGSGSGVFDVFVDKTAAGVESYTLTVTCMTGAGGGGVPTGTAVTGTDGAPVPALSAPGALVLAAGLLAAAALGLRKRAVLLVLALLTHAASVSADNLNNGTLGAAASSTDFYQVTCDTGTGQLVMSIRDETPANAAFVSVQVHKGQLLSNVTDALEGDMLFSPIIQVNGGSGVYEVLVDKSGAGAEGYSLTYHCLAGTDGTGIHTGTTISAVQNQ
jgi:hypothetical protein